MQNSWKMGLLSSCVVGWAGMAPAQEFMLTTPPTIATTAPRTCAEPEGMPVYRGARGAQDPFNARYQQAWSQYRAAQTAQMAQQQQQAELTQLASWRSRHQAKDQMVEGLVYDNASLNESIQVQPNNLRSAPLQLADASTAMTEESRERPGLLKRLFGRKNKAETAVQPDVTVEQPAESLPTPAPSKNKLFSGSSRSAKVDTGEATPIILSEEEFKKLPDVIVLGEVKVQEGQEVDPLKLLKSRTPPSQYKPQPLSPAVTTEQVLPTPAQPVSSRRATSAPVLQPVPTDSGALQPVPTSGRRSFKTSQNVVIPPAMPLLPASNSPLASENVARVVMPTNDFSPIALPVKVDSLPQDRAITQTSGVEPVAGKIETVGLVLPANGSGHSTVGARSALPAQGRADWAVAPRKLDFSTIPVQQELAPPPAKNVADKYTLHYKD